MRSYNDFSNLQQISTVELLDLMFATIHIHVVEWSSTKAACAPVRVGLEGS